jgi:hypothetical protein
VNKQVFGRLGLATIKQGGFTWTVVSAKQHRGWVAVVRAVAAQERVETSLLQFWGLLKQQGEQQKSGGGLGRGRR